MAIVPYDAFRGMERMRNYFDQIFPDTIYPFHLQTPSIPMDLHETDSELIATCDVPGLNSKDDVDIDIVNNVLTIKGTIRKSQEKNQNQYRQRERFEGHFQRMITLPYKVDENNTKATYKNGVLEIRMPKLQQATKGRVDVDFH
ncbi:MAG: Hsp20/alpha crystallin family protein [Tuberibacillus sp.]